jgi:hypothetical protein
VLFSTLEQFIEEDGASAQAQRPFSLLWIPPTFWNSIRQLILGCLPFIPPASLPAGEHQPEKVRALRDVDQPHSVGPVSRSARLCTGREAQHRDNETGIKLHLLLRN